MARASGSNCFPNKKQSAKKKHWVTLYALYDQAGYQTNKSVPGTRGSGHRPLYPNLERNIKIDPKSTWQ